MKKIGLYMLSCLTVRGNVKQSFEREGTRPYPKFKGGKRVVRLPCNKVRFSRHHYQRKQGAYILNNGETPI